MLLDKWRPQAPQLDNNALALKVGARARYISNPDADAWATIYNPLSEPLEVGPIYAGSTGLPPWTAPIPPLTVECVPIDPEGDIYVGLGWDRIAFTGQQLGANVASLDRLFAARTVITRTHPSGVPFSRPMYPIERCQTVTRFNSLGAAGASWHVASPQGATAAVGNIVQLVNPANIAGTSPYTLGPADECCIVAMMATIRSLGATATADNVTCSPFASDNSGLVTGADDVAVWGGSAAGAAGLVANSGIIPLPGVSGVRWTNNNAGATPTVTLSVTYWLGIPSWPVQ